MKLNKTTLVLLFLISSKIQAQVQYPLIVDRTFSMNTGSENLITLHKRLYSLENKYLKIRWFKENSIMRKSAGIFYRLGKTLFLDFALDDFAFLVQHEVFGHGAKYRELGFENITYQLSLPPPYGSGNGSANVRYSLNESPTNHENLAIFIAGLEGNILLANSLQFKWMQCVRINHRETLLYLLSSYSLNLSLKSAKSSPTSKNDILFYLEDLNSHEGYEGTQNYQLTVDDLRKQAFINTFNPFRYFALYAFLKTYLYSGDEEFGLPMIKLWNIKYLPSFRLGLTPFGSEYYFENLVVSSGKTMYFYIRYGNPTFHRFWGFGIKGKNLIDRMTVSINLSLDLWNQPSLILDNSTAAGNQKSLGGAITGTIFSQLSRNYSFINLMGQVGYKTTGYLEGEQLGKGVIARIGLSFLVW